MANIEVKQDTGGAGGEKTERRGKNKSYA